jgi:glyoxylase-like metal-dependent hydrolase (beta-lactamase superfamily II)
MRVVSLGSGSSGNALLIEAGPRKRTKLLIDAGLNGRVLADRLQEVSVHPAQLQGVLVTHEHSDHVLGLPMLMNRYAVPVITDPHTYDVVEASLASGIWHTDSGTLFSPKRMVADKEVRYDNGDGIQGALYENIATYVLPLAVGSRRLVGDIEVESFAV